MGRSSHWLNRKLIFLSTRSEFSHRRLFNVLVLRADLKNRNFTIFSQKSEAGVSIPYPAISIHAVKQSATKQEGYDSQSIWMQLELSDGGVSDDDFNTVDLTILLPVSEDSSSSSASQLYEAIADCSNLNPDPNNDEEDDEEDEFDRIVFEGSAEHQELDGLSGVLHGASDGGLPPPMPGSSGWITADNVHSTSMTRELDWERRPGGRPGRRRWENTD